MCLGDVFGRHVCDPVADVYNGGSEGAKSHNLYQSVRCCGCILRGCPYLMRTDWDWGVRRMTLLLFCKRCSHGTIEVVP